MAEGTIASRVLFLFKEKIESQTSGMGTCAPPEKTTPLLQEALQEILGDGEFSLIRGESQPFINSLPEGILKGDVITFADGSSLCASENGAVSLAEELLV
ncbi:MAG: hypothetical protein OXR68_07655 [Alphaproteobacteria bacterium]|nr:hypothetical protein [Alphaproteobacteria bacterium]MDD9920479.1 hypothetical protein [Alphaproteobacteria bacterium]